MKGLGASSARTRDDRREDLTTELIKMSQSLSPNSTLAHYTIVCKIGAGGMGEVYRARDGKLNREVAIKVLPADIADDEERLMRFKREAQVLASLTIRTSLRFTVSRIPTTSSHWSWSWLKAR